MNVKGVGRFFGDQVETDNWLRRRLEISGDTEAGAGGGTAPDKAPEREIGAVIAKMNCNAVDTSRYSGTYVQHKVRLGAVCGKEGENASFTKYTPSGECWMCIEDGAPAATFFKPGKKYYVTFTEAPD